MCLVPIWYCNCLSVAKDGTRRWLAKYSMFAEVIIHVAHCFLRASLVRLPLPEYSVPTVAHPAVQLQFFSVDESIRSVCAILLTGCLLSCSYVGIRNWPVIQLFSRTRPCSEVAKMVEMGQSESGFWCVRTAGDSNVRNEGLDKRASYKGWMEGG